MTDIKWLRRTREAATEQNRLSRLQGRLEACSQILQLANDEQDLETAKLYRELAETLANVVRAEMPTPPGKVSIDSTGGGNGAGGSSNQVIKWRDAVDEDLI